MAQTCHDLEMQCFLWMLLRMIQSGQSSFPTFSGWQLLVRKTRVILSLKKTVVTYLPPINAPGTLFSTIFSYLLYMQKLCREVNMPFDLVNMPFDLGAAMNAYKLVWNYPEIFGNVIIHLGDFHFMKEIFLILGILTEGSGFEEIVFQSGLSTSGSLNSIISGSHYNRSMPENTRTLFRSIGTTSFRTFSDRQKLRSQRQNHR